MTRRPLIGLAPLVVALCVPAMAYSEEKRPAPSSAESDKPVSVGFGVAVSAGGYDSLVGFGGLELFGRFRVYKYLNFEIAGWLGFFVGGASVGVVGRFPIYARGPIVIAGARVGAGGTFILCLEYADDEEDRMCNTLRGFVEPRLGVAWKSYGLEMQITASVLIHRDPIFKIPPDDDVYTYTGQDEQIFSPIVAVAWIF